MTAVASDLDTVEAVLHGAIALREASLVIFRREVLVEFKTEGLVPGLSVGLEAGRRTWQIGPFEGHHCHLDLAAVRCVLFDAEPVPCQRGRINYSIWFVGDRDCGNPHRSDGLFSVTLNSPYTDDGMPRLSVIGPVFTLFEQFRMRPLVAASYEFLCRAPPMLRDEQNSPAPTK